jgi:acetamidase/formamidase
MPEHRQEEATSTGIGRRELLQGTAALGASAAASSWALPEVAQATAPRRRRRRGGHAHRGPIRVLQPGRGPGQVGHYIEATPDTVQWGRLPNAATPPIATVRSGAVVTLDTVSHEGVLEDQGRDPVEFFSGFGVPRRQVLRDAIAIAASDIQHDFEDDGPHVITGPVAVAGAEPGDVLEIQVLALRPRVPYGVISNRHGKGALPDIFPETPPPEPGADVDHPELFHNVFTFVPVRSVRGRLRGLIPAGPRHQAQIPIDPFPGTFGVALNTSDTVNSIPPNAGGGNLDIQDFTVGSRLWVRVMVPGAKFFVGDPHYAMGDGEIALTALEGSLRATFRLVLHKQGSIPGNRGTLTGPFGETPELWLTIGLDPDLDQAMRNAALATVEFLNGELGMSRANALAYASADVDFAVSQVVDRTKGVHGRISKAHFVQT